MINKYFNFNYKTAFAGFFQNLEVGRRMWKLAHKHTRSKVFAEASVWPLSKFLASLWQNYLDSQIFCLKSPPLNVTLILLWIICNFVKFTFNSELGYQGKYCNFNQIDNIFDSPLWVSSLEYRQWNANIHKNIPNS